MGHTVGAYAILGNFVGGGVLGPAAQSARFYFPKIGSGHSPGSRQNQGENQITSCIRQANWQSVLDRLPVGKGISPVWRLDVYLDPPEHNHPHRPCSSPHWEEQLRRPDGGPANKAHMVLGRCSLKGRGLRLGDRLRGYFFSLLMLIITLVPLSSLLTMTLAVSPALV